MADIRLIEHLLRRSQCSKELAIALLTATMIAYLNGADIMAGKHTKRSAQRSQTSTEETPAQAFHRLGQGRTNKAVKAIGLLAQLTGTAYASTDLQKRAILAALQAAVDQVKDTFEGKSKASDSFKLPS